MSKKKKLKELQTQEKSTLFNNPSLNKFNIILLIFLPLVTIVTTLLFILDSYNKNSFLGFPLDDPWIHLTFAKNLIQYGSFSYFKDLVVTSGSTSPLYTFLLSGLFLIYKNEYIISYMLGIGFFALGAISIYQLTKKDFDDAKWFSVIVGLFFALQPKLNLIAVSGMETTLFIFLIIICFYFYKEEKYLYLGIALGLLIWGRPDGLVVWIAIVIDSVYRMFVNRRLKLKEKNQKFIKDIIHPFIISSIFLVLYFLFNYILSGTLLPNTYSAKIEFYTKPNRTDFIKIEVWEYFSKKEFLILIFPLILSFLIIIKDFIRLKYNKFAIYALFVLGFITMYYIQLPYTHRFGRYLMPIIPFYIILALYGIKSLFNFLFEKSGYKLKNLLSFGFTILLVANFFLMLNSFANNINENTFFGKYHNDRHVKAGLWFKNNTDENAVIGTHDIGAIAFYSDRKVVDMVGLVSPEVIKHFNDNNFVDYIKSYLLKENVSYVALLRNWFQVENSKPVYIPINQPEYLEIFKFDKNLHILDKNTSGMLDQAIYYFQNQQSAYAYNLVNRVLQQDNKSSRAYLIRGLLNQNNKKYIEAERDFYTSLKNYPDFPEAYYALASLKFMQKNYQEAKVNIDKSLELNPNLDEAILLNNEIIKYLNKK